MRKMIRGKKNIPREKRLKTSEPSIPENKTKQIVGGIGWDIKWMAK